MIVDVSEWQGQIDWTRVKASGITRAFIKSSEGINWADPDFHVNWMAAKAAGVPRGAYHFARPDGGNDPNVEAASFLSIVGPLDSDDWIALDYEVIGTGNDAAWVLTWLQNVQAVTGKLPFFYSNYVGCARVASAPGLAQFPLWLAFPGNPFYFPVCPSPWTQIALWQFGTGNIPGINGNVDEDEPIALFGSVSGQIAMEEEMVLLRNPNTQAIYAVGVEGKRVISAEEWGVYGKTMTAADVTTATLASIPDVGRYDRLVLLHDPATQAIYEVGPSGKRLISAQEWATYASNGATYIDVATTELALIVDAPANAGSADPAVILAAIADLKAHPSFDPNDAIMLAIIQKMEGAFKQA